MVTHGGEMNRPLAFLRSPEEIAEAMVQATDGSETTRDLLIFLSFFAPAGLPKSYFFKAKNFLPATLSSLAPEKLLEIFRHLHDHGLVIHTPMDLYLFKSVQGVARQTLDQGAMQAHIVTASRFLFPAYPPNAPNPQVLPHELNRLAWHAGILAELAFKHGARETAMGLMQWLDRSGRILIGRWPDRAITCHQRALSLSEQLLGHGHPITAIRLNNLGETWRRLKELEKADSCLSNAMALMKTKIGANHDMVANIMGNLGLLRLDQGRIPQAQEAFQRALRLTESSRGLDDPLIFLSVNSLARIMAQEKKHQELLHLMERALASHDKLGKNVHHPNVAVVLNNMGIVLRDLGRFEEARKRMTQAMNLLQKFLPAYHPQIQQVKDNIAQLAR